MQTGAISFCDQTAINIKSLDVKKKVMHDIESRFQCKIISKHHVNFDGRALQRLERSPHMACVRTNGNPYFLYLTTFQYEPLCIFIDKKIQDGYQHPRMIISHLRFDEDLYQDTLMDGEMVRSTNNHWVFLVNDLVALRGVYLEKDNLMRRITKAHEVLDKGFKPDDTDHFVVQIKRYVTIDALKDLVEWSMNLPYTCRGLYFRPLFRKFSDILYNFDDSLVKKVKRVKYQANQPFLLNGDVNVKQEPKQEQQSQQQKQTKKEESKQQQQQNPTKKEESKQQQLLLSKTTYPDVFDVIRSGQIIGLAHIPTLAISRELQDLSRSIGLTQKIKVESCFNEKWGKWSVLCVLGPV
jgi:hypothetical protein